MQTEKTTDWVNAEIKLSFTPPATIYNLSSPEASYLFLTKIWDKQLINLQEQFYVVCLNNANNVVAWRCMHTGTANKCLVDHKMIAYLACKSAAQSVIIAHNHPSGNPKPSNADILMTFEIKHTLDVFGIKLWDHLVITENGYYSFNDSKLL